MQNNDKIQPTYVTAYTLTSSLGHGNVATTQSLHAGRGGLRFYQLREGGDTWIGLIDKFADIPIDGALSRYDCRTNRLLRGAISCDNFPQQVERVKRKYGAHRVGLFLGTITAGLAHLEQAYQNNNYKENILGDDLRWYNTVDLYSAAEYCQKYLGITGPSCTVSTACSSSAKVFAIAHRYLKAGLCDAVVVAGLECACDSIVFGFRSLGLLSTEPCRPWDTNRNGLSVGEGAGFALLEREPTSATEIALLGYGESGDAYHMTTPHPQGDGAVAAMRKALKSADLMPHQIDYINLHGSGTPANDSSEDIAVATVFGDNIRCSSTKGWTGHTQGAAGITEAIISMLSMKHGVVPFSMNTRSVYPEAKIRIQMENENHPIRAVLSNSFGFGGNNCALIFGAI